MSFTGSGHSAPLLAEEYGKKGRPNGIMVRVGGGICSRIFIQETRERVT